MRRRLGLVLSLLLVVGGLWSSTSAPGAAAEDPPAALSVRWPATEQLVSPRDMVAVATVGSSASSRSLTLELRAPGSWTPISTTAVPAVPSSDATTMEVAVPVPRRFLGRPTYRLVLRDPDSTVLSDSRMSFDVRPRYTPQGAPGQRSPLEPNGDYIRWNPCAPIDYTVNAHLLRRPRRAIAEVRTALGRVAVATGLTFRYLGPVRQRPTGKRSQVLAKGADLLLGFVPPDDPFLDGDDLLGRARPMDQLVPTGTGGLAQVYTRAHVAISTRATAELVPGFGPRSDTRGALLMHELAHAVGVGHVQARSQLMYPAPGMSTAHTRFGAGDLASLRRVGILQGCLPGL